MASFSVEGLDKAINDLQKMDLFDDETQEELLCDAGDTLVETVKAEMSKSRFRLDGLAAKVTAILKINKYGNRHAVVTAEGKNARGQSNAAVIFVLNYGRREKYGKITGGYFWTTAVQKAQSVITVRLLEIIEKKLKERGLI